MILRPETPADYNKIAVTTYAAFSHNKENSFHFHESEMPSLARQRRLFDPRLSIVAEENSEIIGHVIFTPVDFILSGNIIRGVIPGPVSVLPERQKTGIGKKLMEYGHSIAGEIGMELSLLCGHSDYYPRFGYIKSVFSFQGTTIKINDSSTDFSYTSRAPLPDDVSFLYELQLKVRRMDSLALLLSEDLMDFNTNSSAVDSIVISNKNKSVAYVKRYKSDPGKIKFPFCETYYMESVLRFLAKSSKDGRTLEIQQPFEHYSSLSENPHFLISDMRKTNDAFMIYPLSDNACISKYIAEVTKGTAKPGVISFPPYCDLE